MSEQNPIYSGNTAMQPDAGNAPRSDAGQPAGWPAEPWQAPVQRMPMQGASQGAGPELLEPESELTRRFKENFAFFGPGTLLYAAVYAVCTFHNPSGIAFALFIAASLGFLWLSLGRLGIAKPRTFALYGAGIALLGISTFCTDDSAIIWYNKLGIFLLTMSLLLALFFETARWQLGKWAGSICRLVFESLGELPRPFADLAAHRKSRRKDGIGKGMYVAIGIVVSVPLALIVLLLLSSADAVFGDSVERILRNLRYEDIFGVLVRFVFLFFVTYMMLAFLCKHTIREETEDRRTGEPVIAVTVASVLTLIYLAFCYVQVQMLFLGHLPAKYTYAQYARQGFFELLAVSILNLILVLVMISRFRESRALRGILTLMSLCTFVMIASSAMRMAMYVRVYDLSHDRIVVLWALLVLTLLFVGIVITIYWKRFPLFRYSVAVVTVLYLALSFAHPDAIIARYNLAQYRLVQRDYSDLYYIASLSADAAPAIYEEGGECWEMWQGRHGHAERLIEEEGNLRTFNVSRHRAAKLVEGR